MNKLFMILTAIALSACAAQNMNPETIHLQTTNYLKTISTTDTVRKSDGFKIVNINGETTADTDLFWRINWTDENGMKVDSLMSRSTKSSVRSDVPFTWTAVAPNASAVKYNVYISDRVIEQ